MKTNQDEPARALDGRERFPVLERAHIPIAEVRRASARFGSFARCLTACTFVLSLLCLFPLQAQTTNESATLLDQVAQNLGQADSVFAHFVQERHLSLFDEPLRSEGYLCFQKPGRLRWEIVQPYQSILICDGKGVAQFERISNRWKKLDLGLADALKHVVTQIGAVVGGDYTGKQREYNVSATNTAAGAVITLSPTQTSLRKMLQAIEIHLAPDFRGTQRVVLREVGGDFTDIHFRDQLAKPSLPAATFDCGNPADLDQILSAVEAGTQKSPGAGILR